MKKRMISLMMLLFVVSMPAAGCGKTESAQTEKGSEVLQSDQGNGEQTTEDADIITLTSENVSLENGFSAVKYSGDYKWNEFLEQGGASSDAEGSHIAPYACIAGASTPELLSSQPMTTFIKNFILHFKIYILLNSVSWDSLRKLSLKIVYIVLVGKTTCCLAHSWF